MKKECLIYHHNGHQQHSTGLIDVLSLINNMNLLHLWQKYMQDFKIWQIIKIYHNNGPEFLLSFLFLNIASYTSIFCLFYILYIEVLRLYYTVTIIPQVNST